MLDFISQVGVGGFIALVAVMGGLLIPLTAIIAAFMYQHRQLNVEAALKQQMLERGMSVEEIKEVLEASISGRRGRRRSCSSIHYSKEGG
jgi:hypothetical protein